MTRLLTQLLDGFPQNPKNWKNAEPPPSRQHFSLTIRHLTTYRYRQPVGFGEHRLMLRPRDSHDQRVIEASLEISPQPTSLRFIQDAFGNHVGIARFSGRSKELRFESTVHLEHSPMDATDHEIEDAAFPVDYSTDERPDLAHCIERQHPDRRNEVGLWALQFVPSNGSIGSFKLLTQLSRGIKRGFLYRRRESEGDPAPSGDIPARSRQLPRFRHAYDRGGALARLRREFCLWVSRCPPRRCDRVRGWHRSRVDPRLGASLFSGHGLDRFRPHERQRRQHWPCQCRGRARSVPRDPTPRHLYRVPIGPSRHGRAGECHVGSTRGDFGGSATLLMAQFPPSGLGK